MYLEILQANVLKKGTLIVASNLFVNNLVSQTVPQLRGMQVNMSDLI